MPQPKRSRLRAIYDRAFAALGPQHWWPGGTPFEVCVGAILTQNTAWTNVERALANLKRARLLSPTALAAVPRAVLARHLRPSGYFNVKARRLTAFLKLLTRRFAGRLSNIWKHGPDAAREALLSVNGIGPETADSMLLYAGNLPVFVIDAYTRRILFRHGLCRSDASYAALQAMFHRAFPEKNTQFFNEFHALFVALGKDYCRPRNPRCAVCPLNCLLPPAGVKAKD